MGEIGNDEALGQLLEIFDSERNPKVRVHAAWALARNGSAEHREWMQDAVLRGSPDSSYVAADCGLRVGELEWLDLVIRRLEAEETPHGASSLTYSSLFPQAPDGMFGGCISTGPGTRKKWLAWMKKHRQALEWDSKNERYLVLGLKAPSPDDWRSYQNLTSSFMLWR